MVNYQAVLHTSTESPVTHPVSDSTTAPRILTVDDEPELLAMLSEYLSRQGYSVATAGDGVSMRRLLNEQHFDLALLDINLPGEDGLSLARYLRERYALGIIMLTAADDVIDRIVGLEMGADDYITKPFDPRELLARIKSVLRRASSPAVEPEAATEATSSGNTVRFGRCMLDLDGHRLYRHDNGEDVPLTSMEFDLLKAFAERPNRVLSRDQLLDLAHNRDWEPFDRSIDIRITRIRRKIEIDPAKPQTIKTVRGAGYMFVPQRQG